MYNDMIKAENKIITNENLYLIFQTMGETLNRYKRISDMEIQKNQMLDYAYQEYSFKDLGSRMKVVVDFYDNTNITFDNYENFISIFYSRLDEIKSMNVLFSLSYEVRGAAPNRTTNSFYQHINIYITESKMEIELKLSSEDRKLEELYQLIKNIVLNAPEKYDIVIKEKSKITNVISLSYGIIPAVIVSTVFLFIPVIGSIFLHGFIVYPICAFVLAFFIGGTLASPKIEKFYATIMPEKKYSGYSNGKSVYKDDVEKFVGTSEILIGKKVNNLINREYIKKDYEKYRGILPRNLMILGIASIIVIALGFFL